MGKAGIATAALVFAAAASPCPAMASGTEPAGGDLEAVKRRGVLRHLGVPYARFVSGGGRASTSS